MTGERIEYLLDALDGWSPRDSDGQEPCNVERGTTERGNLEVLAEGLSYAEANVLESALQVAHDAVALFRDVTSRSSA